MVYDGADKYVLLLSGLLANQTEPTWKYSGGHWTELSVSPSPSGRLGAAMVYDPADREVVLFGGEDSTTQTYLNDTWTFSAGGWTQLNPGTDHAPSPRAYPVMAYDRVDRYVVLFGGADFQCSYLSCSGSNGIQETWNFSKGVWNQLNNSTTHPQPPGRSAAELATDGSLGVLLTGGDQFGGCPCFNDTWNFSSGNWTNRTSSVGPIQSISFGSSTYEIGTGNVVVWGGVLANGTASNTTWTFGTSWSRSLATGAPPPPDAQNPIAYDPAIGAVLLFGVPLHAFASGAWSTVGPATLPPPTSNPLLAWDTKDGYAVLFDGTTGSTWSFHHGGWRLLLTLSSLSPPRRTGGALTYDAAAGYVVLFGGQVYTCSGSTCNYWDANDTWTFSAGAWTNVTGSRSPTPRLYAGMSFDTADGYVVLFGGSRCSPTYFSSSCREFNDTWKFAGGVWSLVTPANGTSPSGRHLLSMAYSGASRKVILFGGVNCAFTVTNCVALNDTWSFHAGAWTLLTGKSAPTVRAGASVTYDPTAHAIVLFGGGTVNSYGFWSNFLADTWVWSSSGWTKLAFGGGFGPAPRWGSGFVHLPGSGRDLLVDGGFTPSDVWTLSGA